MSNSYQSAAAVDSLPCSREDYLRLKAVWYNDDETYQHGLDIEFYEEQEKPAIFIFGEEYANEDFLSYTALKLLGEIIEKAGEPYLAFGVASYDDKCRPDSQHGYAFRVLASGKIEYPTITWKSDAPK